MAIDDLVLDGPIETETTLVILSRDPVSVRNRIARLSTFDGFTLNKVKPQKLRDVYFDSISGSLSAKKLGIRLRETGGKRIIGLKGEQRTNQTGSIERVEIELDWTFGAWERILELLSQAGVRDPLYPIAFDPKHPIQAFINSDFKILQERSTRRIVRDIVSVSLGGPTLSEMVIDDVSFKVGELVIHHYEVEVEIKSAVGDPSLTAAIKGLMNKFGPELRIWYHSKLSTGQAIVDLISDGRLKPLISTNNSLRPEAYDLIHDYLLFKS